MTPQKRVIVIGGTGFLGYNAVKELLAADWSVTALGLPPKPPPSGLVGSTDLPLFPDPIKLVYLDLEQVSDAHLQEILRGHTALVYATGADDRYTPRKPAYPFFHHANVEICCRVLEQAVKAGVKHAVILGSYFAHFNRIWPDLRLAERHPYIRSRMEQEEMISTIPGLDVEVLELPYIFGGVPLPDWKPLWKPLVKYIRMLRIIFYMQGGTACITATTVGKAVVGALARGKAGTCYPIGDENLTWSELLNRLAAADGTKVRVVILPNWLVQMTFHTIWLVHWLIGREAGLDLRHFITLQTAETFIDPVPSQEILGYQTGGLYQAIQETVKYS